MKISSKTVLYTMRIIGGIIIMAAFGLIGYLSWITSKVGLDGFLVLGFGVGAVTLLVSITIIYLSLRITFEEDVEVKEDSLDNNEKNYARFKSCG